MLQWHHVLAAAEAPTTVTMSGRTCTTNRTRAYNGLVSVKMGWFMSKWGGLTN